MQGHVNQGTGNDHTIPDRSATQAKLEHHTAAFGSLPYFNTQPKQMGGSEHVKIIQVTRVRPAMWQSSTADIELAVAPAHELRHDAMCAVSCVRVVPLDRTATFFSTPTSSWGMQSTEAWTAALAEAGPKPVLVDFYADCELWWG
jgi:hypothetical protein